MRLPMLVALPLVCAVTAAAQTAPPATADPAPLSGTWEGSFDHEGSLWHVAFVLQQQDTTLKGVLYKDGEEYGPVTGVVRGAAYAFHLDGVVFEGTVEGDRMKVVMTVINGTKYPFVMVRRSTTK